MQQSALVIPDKLFFKIGEVCDIVGVQPHVLRYWESEFPMLQPQKNRAGQRTYRRKDVEMALRIRELLYEEGFTIAGAKRKLLGEGRSGGSSRLQIVPPGGIPSDEPEAPPEPTTPEPTPQISRLSRDTIKRLKLMAEELLTSLKADVKK